MRAWFSGGLLALCLCSCSVTDTPATQTDAEQQLQQVIDESWQYRRAISPALDARLGNRNAASQLEDVSPAALAKRNQTFIRQLAALDAIDDAQLTQEQRINKAILHYQLQNRVDSYRFNFHTMPINAEGGFHTEMGFLSRRFSFRSVQDFNDYIQLLTQIPRYFQQQIGWMQTGIEAGYIQPAITLAGIEHSIRSYIDENPEHSPFFRPFSTRPEYISPAEWEQLQQRVKAVIINEVEPAYQSLLQFMTTQYLPAARARKQVGLSELPQGMAAYANRVKHFTTLDMSIDEVHKLGLQEVARIQAEMQQVINDLQFKGSFADFIQFLRTDPQFYAPTGDALLKEAAWLAKQADAQLPAYFKTLPRRSYGVKAVPADIAPKYTTGRYSGASREGEAGYYWVNTYALEKRPLYALPALTLHEAVPGHHLQISLSDELSNLPDYRRYSYISAFGEGWALYSEFLGVEMGIYDTPYKDFGRLTYEMWRACRLVIDTGIHAKGWSRQQAIDYLAQHTALSMHNVQTEIDRYIGWPGQALSYKMGELAIKRLRQQAQQQLGEQFDIRTFHDEVLKHGSVPLSVLEQLIGDYIQQQATEMEAAKLGTQS